MLCCLRLPPLRNRPPTRTCLPGGRQHPMTSPASLALKEQRVLMALSWIQIGRPTHRNAYGNDPLEQAGAALPHMAATPSRWSREGRTNQLPATHLQPVNQSGLFLFQHGMKQSLVELARDRHRPFAMELSTPRVQLAGSTPSKAARARSCGEKILLLIWALIEQHTPRQLPGDDQALHLSRTNWSLSLPAAREKPRTLKTSMTAISIPQRRPMFLLSPTTGQQGIRYGSPVRNKSRTRHLRYSA